MTKEVITLKKDVLDSIDLSHLEQYLEWSSNNLKYFNMESGKEHYKLLAYLSKVLTCKKLIDIGHYHGFSSVALSYNENKIVNSYDIFNWLPDDGSLTSENRDNVNLYIEDYLSKIPDLIADCDMVMIDIDHSGATEKLIMEELRKAGYKGMVLLDDIYLNEEMKSFYAEIPEKKVDISAYGHWSGTAIVFFDESKFDVVLA